MEDNDRPRSLRAGAGKDGGGVDGREGRGDDAREDSRAVGVDGGGVMDSRVEGSGWSRRCMRFEKNPDIRFDGRVCHISPLVSAR